MARTQLQDAAQICTALVCDLEQTNALMTRNGQALHALSVLARVDGSPAQRMPDLKRDDLAALLDVLAQSVSLVAIEHNDQLSTARRLLA